MDERERHDEGKVAGGQDDVISHRRLRQRRGVMRTSLGVNMVPMIDVVFQILVYFLVATDFRMGEEILRMDLPLRAESAGQTDPFKLDELPLRITVATIGERRGDVRLRVEGPHDQPRDFDELYRFLRDRQIGPGTLGGLFLASHPIIIEPDGAARWEHAVEAVNAAARARYTNVTLSRPGDGR